MSQWVPGFHSGLESGPAALCVLPPHPSWSCPSARLKASLPTKKLEMGSQTCPVGNEKFSSIFGNMDFVKV